MHIRLFVPGGTTLRSNSGLAKEGPMQMRATSAGAFGPVPL